VLSLKRVLAAALGSACAVGKSFEVVAGDTPIEAAVASL